MQLSKLLKNCTEKLKKAEIEASTIEAGAILCHVLKIDRAYLFAHPEADIDEDKMEAIVEITEKRIKRVPLQQLLGVQEFMSLDFKVDENVLIPRQDTEVLVETVIEHCKSLSGKIKILELGTGSGCIAVSLAKYIKNAFVTTADISGKAINIAKQNAESNKVSERVTFIESDLFSNINERDFDVIVSNPPYIPTEDIKALEPEVKVYEPMLALDGGDDGLDFYRRISEGAKNHLRDNGFIAFEVGIHQAQMVFDILKNDRYYDINIIKDLSMIDRVVCGRFNPSRFL